MYKVYNYNCSKGTELERLGINMKAMKITNGSKEFIAKIGKKFVHKKYGVVTVVKMYRALDDKYIVFENNLGQTFREYAHLNSRLYTNIIFEIV